MVTLTLFSFIKICFSLSFGKLRCSLIQCELFRATRVMVLLIVPHVFMCVSFSPSLLHAAWGLASLWSAPMGSAQVTPGTPLCLLTTGDHQSPGKREGTGNGPSSVGSPGQLYQSWTDSSFITSSHPLPAQSPIHPSNHHYLLVPIHTSLYSSTTPSYQGLINTYYVPGIVLNIEEYNNKQKRQILIS